MEKTKSFEPAGGESALFKAAMGGDEREVAQWLARHPETTAIEARQGGWAALMRAVPQAECVRLLLPLRDPLARGEAGETALSLASEDLAVACVEQLLGVSEARNRDCGGMTPLMRAAGQQSARSEDAVECVRLLAPGSDVDALNDKGLSALDLAIKNHLWEAADILASLSEAHLRAQTLHRHGMEKRPISGALWESEILRQAVEAQPSASETEANESRRALARAAQRL